MGWQFNPFTGKFDYFETVPNPLLFKGEIEVNTDFPYLADVKVGWFYVVNQDVTDNAGSPYTNTGQSFNAGDEIAWNGTNWSILGNASVSANRYLSNLLSPTSINQNLLPANSNINIGSLANPFNSIYTNTLYLQNNGATGSVYYTQSNDTLWISPNILRISNLIPNSDDTYNLGSNELRWANLYLGGDSINFGNSTTNRSISFINIPSENIIRFAINSETYFTETPEATKVTIIDKNAHTGGTFIYDDGFIANTTGIASSYANIMGFSPRYTFYLGNYDTISGFDRAGYFERNIGGIARKFTICDIYASGIFDDNSSRTVRLSDSVNDCSLSASYGAKEVYICKYNDYVGKFKEGSFYVNLVDSSNGKGAIIGGPYGDIQLISSIGMIYSNNGDANIIALPMNNMYGLQIEKLGNNADGDKIAYYGYASNATNYTYSGFFGISTTNAGTAVQGFNGLNHFGALGYYNRTRQIPNPNYSILNHAGVLGYDSNSGCIGALAVTTKPSIKNMAGYFTDSVNEVQICDSSEAMILKGYAIYETHPTFTRDTELVDKKYVDDMAGNWTREDTKSLLRPTTAGDSVRVDNILYLGGDETAEGAWRIRINGNNLEIERLESGNWISKLTINS